MLTENFCFKLSLSKEMAAHFSILAWRIPWTDEPGGLWSAAAAKSLQSCPTLCDPIDGSPPGSPVPGILQARTLEWGAISSSSAGKWKVKVKSLSLVWLLATPWTAAPQAPPSMGFSGQEYWSGAPLPSPALWSVGLQRVGHDWVTERANMQVLNRETWVAYNLFSWVGKEWAWYRRKEWQHLPWEGRDLGQARMLLDGKEITEFEMLVTLVSTPASHLADVETET